MNKHAECFFKQNLKIKFCSSERISRVFVSQWKVQVLTKHAAEQQKYQQSLLPEDKAQMLTKNADTEKMTQVPFSWEKVQPFSS
jgi:hypothetical protein